MVSTPIEDVPQHKVNMDLLVDGMTPMKVAILASNFYSAMHILKESSNFEMLFLYLASLDYSETMAVVTLFRTHTMQALPLLKAQGFEFDFTYVENARMVSAAPHNIFSLVEKMRESKLFSQFPRVQVEFHNEKVVTIGRTEQDGLLIMYALSLAGTTDGFQMLLSEMGKKDSKIVGLINNQKFNSSVENRLHDLPSQFSILKETLLDIHGFLRNYCDFSQIALFVALKICEDFITDDFLSHYNVVYPGGPKNDEILIAPLELAQYYHSLTLDSVAEVVNLDAPLPWERTAALTVYDDMNKTIVRALDKASLVGSGDFRQTCGNVVDDRFFVAHKAIDDYGRSLRDARMANPQWDNKSKNFSGLLNCDMAIPFVTGRVLGDMPNRALFVASSEISSFALNLDHEARKVYVCGPPVNSGAKYKNFPISDAPRFVAELKKSVDSVLLIDNLVVEVSALDQTKSWITTDSAKAPTRFAIDLIYNIFGSNNDQRPALAEIPAYLIWRTVLPYDQYNSRVYDRAINRLTTFYFLKYLPPQTPHELQFTLFCTRRKTYQTKFVVDNVEPLAPDLAALGFDKFSLDDPLFVPCSVPVINGTQVHLFNRGRKRRVSYALRHVDVSRLYFGVIYRHLVYKNAITSYASKLMRDAFTRILSDGLHLTKNLVPLEGTRLINQAKFYGEEECAASIDRTMKFFHRCGFHGKGANKKKAPKRHLDDMLSVLESYHDSAPKAFIDPKVFDNTVNDDGGEDDDVPLTPLLPHDVSALKEHQITAALLQIRENIYVPFESKLVCEFHDNQIIVGYSDGLGGQTTCSVFIKDVETQMGKTGSGCFEAIRALLIKWYKFRPLD